MRSLKDLFTTPKRVAGPTLVPVDVNALMRENIRLLVENTELKCNLAAGGKATAGNNRARYRAKANEIATSMGVALPFAGQEPDMGPVGVTFTVGRVK